MSIIVRRETESDYKTVEEITTTAFKDMPFSEGNEAALISNLRKRGDFIPDLSLVAEIDGTIVGHILFTPLDIVNGNIKYKSLVLAPVSVLPDYQNQGIGSLLINEGHRVALAHGFSSAIVVGHPEYYPRFGYKTAEKFNIAPPFEMPPGVFMAIELVPGALEGVSGMAVFSDEFH